MCNVLLRDPLNRLWQTGVTDNGLLTTDLTTITSPLPQGPILQGLLTVSTNVSSGYGVGGFGVGGFGGTTVTTSFPVNSWHLSADTQGRIVADLVPNPVAPQVALPFFPIVSAGGFNWNISIDNNGILQSDLGSPATGGNFQDVIPYPLDVSMSRWPLSTGIFCTTCGNASVTVSGDLSCWCCACNSFVPPEDTNMIVVLEE